MKYRFFDWAFLAIVLIAVLVLFAFFFERIPTQNNTLAMDWKAIWPSFRDGNLQYLPVIGGLRFPPWSVIPFLPLGFLSMQASWGILAGIGILILVISVPRVNSKIIYWLSIFLLVISFPALRNIADGNMENIVVGGVLLSIYGYDKKNVFALAAGILIATIKIQEVTLLLLVVAFYLFLTWHPGDYLKLGVILTGIIGLSLIYRGKDWLAAVFGQNYQQYTGSIIDISITAALKRLGFVPPSIIWLVWITILGCFLYIAWRSRPALSREKVGMLVAGSLLLAPYAAGNSVLSVLAIGIIPLFQANQLWGGFLIALIDLPFLWSKDMLFNYQAYYWTAIVLVTWISLAWRCIFTVIQEERCQGR
ncbi:MAG: hypothetical protein GYA34_16840 [Chloroflexi bacterium]|nr:hypothetical protein [Chloroflexota bacterium]